ncbi:MAG TPA: thaumatin family protein [Actinospica sp.]|nr:thaumatin family protein [Actinospica sp.]
MKRRKGNRGRRPADRRRGRGIPVWLGAAAGAIVIAAAAATVFRGGGTPVSSAAGSQPSHPVSVVLSAVPSGSVSATATASASASASASTSASASESPASKNAASSSGASKTAEPGSMTAPAGWRTVTFVNSVSQTVWVAAGEQTPQPALGTTGWVLPAGQSLTIKVPDKWNGRFWGRTGCTFNVSGQGHCTTGDCAGKFQCTQYGAIPATLAEFNLNSWDDLDFYDVSMVDGSNLPMYIDIARGGTKDPMSSSGCTSAGCTKPVACPAALAVDGGAGCESACGVFGTDQYCCRSQWASRAACDPAQWPVDYARVFKTAEPYAYSYVDDDATSTFTCADECDYRITFGITP